MRLHRLRHLALTIAVTLGGAFVVLLLAFGEADFKLDASSHVMQVDGHQRIAGALNLDDHLLDFSGVQQALARARRFRVDVCRGRCQGTDVRAEQEHFVATYDDVRFLELDAAGTNRFGFPALQREAGFEAFFDKVIVECFSVINYGHEVKIDAVG
ncbi:MAG: hypothetical protein ACI802_000079 [Candidatus Paceibacteria bacterium]|jgi:hypothetical protein